MASKARPVVLSLLVIAGGVAAIFFLPSSGPGAGSGSLAERLAPPAAAVEPGLALAVVLDTSGSMNSNPRSGGGARSKIEIARGAVRALVGRVHAFSRTNPDRAVLLGLFEFNAGLKDHCREIVPFGPPDPAAAERAVAELKPDGGTPIGDAMVMAKRALDRTRRSDLHLLVVTDGDNTDGLDPREVVRAIAALPAERRPSVYLVAFDIDSAAFQGVREAGALVVSATNEPELQETLDVLLGEKILLEAPTPKKK